MWTAFRSGPLTAKAAAAAGFITSGKYKHDAMKTILHSNQATGDPAAVFAAKDEDTSEFVFDHLARQSQSPFCHVAEQQASAASLQQAASAQMQKRGPGLSADQLVARLAECQLSGHNKGAAVITDIGDGVGVRRTSMVSMHRYIEVRCLCMCHNYMSHKYSHMFTFTYILASSSDAAAWESSR